MSMETSMIYGYGFMTDKIKDKTLFDFVRENMEKLSETSYNSLENMLETLTKHNMNFDSDNVIRKASDILQSLDEMETDHIEDDLLYDLRNTLLSCVAEIMRENDIWFEYQQGQDGMLGEGGAIILSATMPWNFNSEEKELTQEGFTNLCKKYTALLGIPDEPVENITIEYFG